MVVTAVVLAPRTAVRMVATPEVIPAVVTMAAVAATMMTT